MATSRRTFLKNAGIAGAGAGLAWKGLDRLLSPDKVDASTQISITGVSNMANMPSPYNMRDWKSIAQAYDAFSFNLNATGEFLPVAALIPAVNYTGTSFEQPAYVGSDIAKTSQGIGSLAAVVGATLVGIDKTSQAHNYVNMCKNWYLGNTNNNQQYLYLNTPTTQSGGSFWYDLFPNILFYQLNYLYPGINGFANQFLAIADKMYAASVVLQGATNQYDYIGFNFSTSVMQPVDIGCETQPDSAAAFAWLGYMAYVVNGSPNYLQTANWGMEFLNQQTSSPFYEVLLPFGAYLSARMNAEQGTTYNTSQLLNWCFDGSSLQRPGWGVLTNSTVGLNGLVGQTNDSYVFAMNSFDQAGALVPMVRYDTRFAHDIGKWVLNLANAAAFFYNGPLDTAHQSNPTWTSTYDTQGIIAYEGVLPWKPGTATALSESTPPTIGSIVTGDYTATQYRGELPNTLYEVLQEAVVGSTLQLQQVWTFNAPGGTEYFVVVAHASGDTAANFQFSYSTTGPSGPWTSMPAVAIPGTAPIAACNGVTPTDWTKFYKFPSPTPSGTIYIQASSNRTGTTPAQLWIEAMGICYQTNVAPFGLGAPIGRFAINPSGVFPGILYGRESDYTGLGLYGSSHVGILGGMVSTTNVTGILSLDLLKTDYYHAPAYASSLIYNPLTAQQSVQVNVGSGATDLYDAVSHQWVATNVTGTVNVSVASDTAVVIVQVPHGATQTTKGNQLLANGVVIDWNVTA